MAAGHSATFVAACLVILIWAITGPLFHYSDTWQLIINTGTTIITFLMVFLIQNTQNRESTAMQLKLDELIRSVQGAHNRLLNLEERSTEELESLRKRYQAIAERAGTDHLADTTVEDVMTEEEPDESPPRSAA